MRGMLNLTNMAFLVKLLFVVLAINLVLGGPARRQNELLDELERLLEDEDILSHLEHSSLHVEKKSLADEEPGITPLVRRNHQHPPLKIAAFNVQVFGTTKYSNLEVRQILIKILSKYDLVLFQEIRDSSQTVFPNLVSELNDVTGSAYAFVISARLGRTNSKEQYAYIYNKSRIEVIDQYTYEEPADADYFEREPFCILISAPDCALERFSVIGIHTKPSEAESEISHLTKVYDKVSSLFKTQDALLMGDFNAGCGYVSATEWINVDLKNDPRFTWLIGNDVDTTVSSSHCPYDRFVSAGKGMLDAYVDKSATIFNFMDAYNLDLEKAKKVSDHYPIQMFLYGKADEVVEKSHAEVTFVVPSPTHAESNPIGLLQSFATNGTTVGGFVPMLVAVTGKVRDSVIKVETEVDCSEILAKLDTFKAAYPEMMSDVVIALVATYLNSGLLQAAPPIPGLLQNGEPSHYCSVEIRYDIMQPYNYSVSVKKMMR